MLLTRLSTMMTRSETESIRPASHDKTKPTEDKVQTPRTLRILVQSFTILFLLLCLLLTLLSLLVPTGSFHLSVFTIRPMGKQSMPVISTPDGLQTVDGLNITEFQDVTMTNRSSGPVMGVELRERMAQDDTSAVGLWQGIQGPSIWIGVMRE